MRFDNAIALAKRMIVKNGQVVTWKQVKDTANDAEPWNPTEAVDVSKKVSICFIPPRDNEWRKLLAYLKGSEVPSGRLAGLMAPQTFEPNLKDIVVRNGVELRIASIDKLAPNEQTVLYTIEFYG